MAFLKKPMAKPGDVVVEPPPPGPGDDPPPPPLPPDAVVSTTTDQPKVAMDGTVTKPPEPVTLLMSVDGGLNGQCWRAGQTVVLPASAADLYLAKGHATRVK